MDNPIVPLSEKNTALRACYIFVLLVFACVAFALLIMLLRDCFSRSDGKVLQKSRNFGEEFETAHVFCPPESPMLYTRDKHHPWFSRVGLSRKETTHWRKLLPLQKWIQQREQTYLGGVLDQKKSRQPVKARTRSDTSRSIHFKEPLTSPDSESIILTNESDKKEVMCRSRYLEMIKDDHSNGPTRVSVRKPAIIRYSIEELFLLQNDIVFVVPKGDTFRTSQLLHSLAALPTPNSLTMGRQLSQIVEYVVSDNKQVRCMGLFMLLAAGAFLAPFSNYVHFDATYCALILRVIDFLIMFTDTEQMPVLQAQLVELGCSFAWEHWSAYRGGEQNANEKMQLSEKQLPKIEGVTSVICQGVGSAERLKFAQAYVQDNLDRAVRLHQNQNWNQVQKFDVFNTLSDEDYEMEVLLSVVHQPARQWKSNDSLTILDVTFTFRILCNMYLGSPCLAACVRSYCMFRLSGVFRACAARVPCHKHLELLPLVDQAITTARRSSIRIFFFEILKDMVLCHLDCCIAPAHIFAATAPIQFLIQSGLLPQQPIRVQKIAAEMKALIVRKHPEAKNWGPSRGDAINRRLEVAPGAWEWPT